MELITKYFPNLTDEQRLQFAGLYDLYYDPLDCRTPVWT